MKKPVDEGDGMNGVKSEDVEVGVCEAVLDIKLAGGDDSMGGESVLLPGAGFAVS
jgi:hypothetical protein